jgi:hypothetical protein
MGQFWVHLLLSANYRESTSRRGLKTLTVKRGQLLTSIEKLSPAVRRDRKTIRAWLRAFASDGMLDIETDCGGDGGYTLLTIRNYEKYQGTDAAGVDDALDDALPDEVDDGLDSQLPGGLDGGLPTSKKLKKKEKNQSEESKNGASAPVRPTRSGFDLFWQAYPNKTGKDDALAVWLGGKTKAGRPIPPLDIALAALERAKASHDWTKDNGRYIPNPATWLRQGRWQDEPRTNGHDPRRVNAAWAGEVQETAS